ncbi:hypothetical protein GCM10027610_094340 [Dactylosporangium cerinum]
MLGSPYQGYLYAYPHKTAYRPLRPRPRLADVWAAEPTGALFLYVHVPFCEMRCGFCNLFTRALPPAAQVTAYLDQLGRQADRVAAAVPAASYARAAVGGGTPTYLTAAELTRLFDIVERATGAELRAVPMSVETSPATATADRLAVLVERGTTRVSIGVQSFLDAEAHAAGRPQHRAEVDRALDTIRAAGPVELNIDLIYGIPGQTTDTWTSSLRTALTWRPEELYLYPLYVRPMTGLGRRAPGAADPEWDAHRLGLYRHAVDLLADAGYEQQSMRAFRRRDAPPADDAEGPGYCCQDDGMVGLGCGARSYTSALHYSFDYAVSVRQVRGILDDYLARPAGTSTSPRSGSCSTAPSSAAAGCSSRCCGRRGWCPATTWRASAPPSTTTSRRCACSARAATSTGTGSPPRGSRTPTRSGRGSPPTASAPRWPGTCRGEDPLPRAPGQLQLRLCVLPVREAARPARAAARRPGRPGALRGVGRGPAGADRGAVHAVG